MDAYVELARRSIEAYVRRREVLPPPPEVTESMRSRRAGVFVSLKRQGTLRGCIGTILPTMETVAEEIIENAIKAATADPRFPAVGDGDLAELEISVDVLSSLEPCRADELDPQRYGIVVEQGWRRGLLLPALEGVKTAAQQIEIARTKAGIAPKEPVDLLRFTVERHTAGAG